MNALKTGVSFEMEALSGLITLIYLGNTEDDNILGAYGLALALGNLFGTCMGYGISAGLESMSAHAFGMKEF